MRILKTMILGFTILCIIYLTPPGLTKTGDDDPVSIGDENLSEPIADAGFDCAMPNAIQQMGQYFMVYDGENYTGNAYRVYYPGVECARLYYLWDNDGIRIGDKWGGSPESYIYVRIKSIKTYPYVSVTLYEEENYKGYCLTITKNTPSLRPVLDYIRSIKVQGPCPQNLSTKIFNFTIQNNGGTRIRYRLNVNGEWELWNPVRAGKSETPSVRSNQIVTIEIQHLDMVIWKDLCKHDLDWKRHNTITIKHKGIKIWCEKK
ncbi:MAG: hypothetical protein GTO17_02835 [Candidatus Aminicenantes bacterium]|nr:hypothetical protein [Candidatus Aminicenantes bacterium]